MSAPREPALLQRFTHDAMACTFGIQLAARDPRYAAQAARAAFREIERLELLLSRFVAHSEIAQINAARPGAWVAIGPETAECLQLAHVASQATAGAFDVAFRTRRNVPAAPRDVPPLVFDPARHAVAVQYAGVELDLGAVGKGYAVDRALAVLRTWNIAAALIDSGQSTVFALGEHPAGEPWRVGLRPPAEPERVWATLGLRDRAFSGSGQVLHGAHIIDPRSGTPVLPTHAAWAVADSAAWSDALSTAFMVLSAAEVAAVCARQSDVAAILRIESAAEPVWRTHPPDLPGFTLVTR